MIPGYSTENGTDRLNIEISSSVEAGFARMFRINALIRSFQWLMYSTATVYESAALPIASLSITSQLKTVII